MLRRSLTVLIALSSGLPALAAPETMLCLHRDGRIRVEPFEPSCCKEEHPEPATPSCPDEECQDLPVVESGPIVAADASITLELSSTVAEPPAERILLLPIAEASRPRSFSGPPPPGPERHVTTVVLRR